MANLATQTKTRHPRADTCARCRCLPRLTGERIREWLSALAHKHSTCSQTEHLLTNTRDCQNKSALYSGMPRCLGVASMQLDRSPVNRWIVKP